jgi:hypothetical protein
LEIRLSSGPKDTFSLEEMENQLTKEAKQGKRANGEMSERGALWWCWPEKG